MRVKIPKVVPNGRSESDKIAPISASLRADPWFASSARPPSSPNRLEWSSPLFFLDACIDDHGSFLI